MAARGLLFPGQLSESTPGLGIDEDRIIAESGSAAWRKGDQAIAPARECLYSARLPAIAMLQTNRAVRLSSDTSFNSSSSMAICSMLLIPSPP
jgi:hypothetical protein